MREVMTMSIGPIFATTVAAIGLSFVAYLRRAADRETYLQERRENFSRMTAQLEGLAKAFAAINFGFAPLVEAMQQAFGYCEFCSRYGDARLQSTATKED